MPDLTTTMHTHFFLDNRVWRQAAANFSSYMEEDECYTNEYKLCEALSMGQKFLYIFDFGEDVDQGRLEEGDSVTVTYTGELGSEDPVPVAVSVEKTDAV